MSDRPLILFPSPERADRENKFTAVHAPRMGPGPRRRRRRRRPTGLGPARYLCRTIFRSCLLGRAK